MIASTESRHARSAGLHALSPATAAAILCDAQSAAAAVRAAIPAIVAAADAAAQALSAGHRLAYAGAGSSGVMALADALEIAGTFGLAPGRTPVLLAGGAAALLHMTGGVEDDGAAAVADLARLDLRPGEALIAVSASGTTPYTVRLAEAAQAAGVLVIGIANVAGRPRRRAADGAVLLDTGPEVVAGSTRMGAATAQKIALNTISTLAALRLGHVHDGLMVNVVADNAKLRARAARIVAQIAGAELPTAEAALASSAGAVKPAILIAAGADRAAAEGLLATHRGHLGPALAALAEQRSRDPNGPTNRETTE